MKTIRTTMLSSRKGTLMRKSLAAFRLAVVAACAVSATNLMAAVIPPIGLAPGSQYQLIFVTADTRDATSSNIADYNAFVTAEAALNPALPGTTWHAVASTATVDANTNAPSLPGIPIYNTLGQEVAPGVTGLYVNNLGNAPGYDQFGNQHLFADVWTGTAIPGIAYGPYFMGSLVTASIGIPISGYPGGWINYSTDFGRPPTTLDALYALSSPITVPTPEPATFVLLGSAFLLIGGHRFLRWRRAV